MNMGPLSHSNATSRQLGTVVFLATQRRQGSMWNLDRFCLLMRAVRSFNNHLNVNYGPYPIHILVAKDHQFDPEHKDGPYTARDRALIRAWAPNSTIHFVEVNMYSEDALEPNMDVKQAQKWKETQSSSYAHGIGYAADYGVDDCNKWIYYDRSNIICAWMMIVCWWKMCHLIVLKE